MGDTLTTADQAAVSGVRRTLEDVGGTLVNARGPLHDAAATARSGAGQVAGLLEDGLGRFEQSWAGVLATLGQTCGLLAVNTGRFQTTVTTVDVDSTVRVVL